MCRLGRVRKGSVCLASASGHASVRLERVGIGGGLGAIFCSAGFGVPGQQKYIDFGLFWRRQSVRCLDLGQMICLVWVLVAHFGSGDFRAVEIAIPLAF